MAYYRHAQEVLSICCHLINVITIICVIGPLLSFPVINAKISVEQLSYAQGSSPAMGQVCAVECMAKVRSLKLHTLCWMYCSFIKRC